MSKRFDETVALAKRLPEQEQDRLADLLQAEMTHGEQGTMLSDAQIREIERRLNNPGRSFTLEEAEVLLKKFGV